MLCDLVYLKYNSDPIIQRPTTKPEIQCKPRIFINFLSALNQEKKTKL